MAAMRQEEERWKAEEARKRKAAQEAREREVAKEAREREERERREREKRAAEERRAQAEREKAERERLAQEARERLRLEREAREREKQERLEAQRRRETLLLATEKEVDRCRERDRAFAGIRFLWGAPNAITRFRQISLEFDTISFSETQPFTFESAPWPSLLYPGALSVDDIDWGMVEAFFQAAKRILPLADYKDLVEKSHKRFHPDRWRSRRLLVNIIDEELRGQIEKAGNVVSQALTPLWLAARQT
jgi:flagellar biosynthesis GTPase FlhF